MRVPVITLWQPWASWVAIGWKTIETRTHTRFRSLEGRRIGIHASQRWDNKAIDLARPYLTEEQIEHTQSYLKSGPRGAIICTTRVINHRWLTRSHSRDALISCADGSRYGLFLSEPQLLLEDFTIAGKQGIWYTECPVE